MALTHLMIDTETLGKKERAVILSISIVPFTFEEVKSFKEYIENGIFIKFNAKEQITKYNRNVEEVTINWWKTQSQEAREKNLTPKKEDYLLRDGLIEISKFIGLSGYNKKSYIWARGASFDFPKFESLYDDCDLGIPVNMWKARDTRTFIDIFNGVDDAKYELDSGIPQGFIQHDSLHDASLECMKLVELYQKSL